MEKRALLYTGKSKAIYATDDPDLVIIHYNDDATAGNGAKHEIIEGKGILNNRIATLISVRSSPPVSRPTTATP